MPGKSLAIKVTISNLWPNSAKHCCEQSWVVLARLRGIHPNFHQSQKFSTNTAKTKARGEFGNKSNSFKSIAKLSQTSLGAVPGSTSGEPPGTPPQHASWVIKRLKKHLQTNSSLEARELGYETVGKTKHRRTLPGKFEKTELGHKRVRVRDLALSRLGHKHVRKP